MAFDFSNASGEAFGDIENVFFTKDGKNFLETENQTSNKVDLKKLNESVQEKANQESITKNTSSGTIIQISKDIIGTDTDLQIQLTELEERRMNMSSVRNKAYINMNTGEDITIIEKTEMYNGTNLYTVKQENGKMITYPRSMFVGSEKCFVPKEFYIREAERALEDSVNNNYEIINEMIKNQHNMIETSDSKYLELLLDKPMDIVGNINVPNKVQIPVKRMFDMNYKILVLEYVICMDNKIAALLFTDIWF